MQENNGAWCMSLTKCCVEDGRTAVLTQDNELVQSLYRKKNKRLEMASKSISVHIVNNTGNQAASQ